jgi:hypothetical protein
MPERLELTKNVQFYKTNNCLDESVLSDVLNEATSNQEQDSNFILDVFRDIKVTTANIEYKLTVKVFQQRNQSIF